ncbi:MAG TPA: ABC transporter substrate-binding protein [Gaiellaceae bacterium]|nr:ABC transporter substrate-binding protein [Gaiellaceae bacterium]
MTATAGERRVIAVLVADIVGSTAIGERLGPERSKFLFDEIVQLMAEQVRRFEGTVAQLTGDGVLALFGAPTAHDDDSERAVRAALAIHEALGGYADEVEKAYGVTLTARVGVNTGPVVVPSGDAPPAVLYNALGDTVNVAARLQALAGDGGVAVGPATARRVESHFELDSLGAADLKGKNEPVEAFQVTGERCDLPAARGPLVGRDADICALEEILGELLDGGGAIVSIVGEPGIGKSRLVSEARGSFAHRIRFLEGQAAAYAEAIPYWPIRDLLRSWLGLGVSDPEARRRLELKARLAQVGSDEAYPFLANLLGLALEPENAQRLVELSPDSVQRQTFEAVNDLVRALAREQPLCLVLDDLHWADQTTLELVEQLLSVAGEEALVLVLVYRSEREHGCWRLGEQARRLYPHRFTELVLAPLDPEAIRELSKSVAGSALPHELEAVIADRTGGNPFFVEEAVRDLLERAALEPGTEGITVPTRVQEALQARLGRLTPGTHELVGVASVIGRIFGLPLLERVAPDHDLGRALSELQRLDLVVEERRRPAVEYRFRHGLVQEVAYASLLEQRRQDLHAAVGRALEEIHHDSPAEVVGLLAHHFSEAHDPEKAAEYLLQAGDAARAVYSDREADGHYRRALAFLDELGDERRARDTLLRIGLAHHLAFDFAAAARAYDEAFGRGVPEMPSAEPTERLSTATAEGKFVPGEVMSEWLAAFSQNLFRGLLRADRDLNVIPDLAESFSMSSDGLTYRFRLRENARWSDGVPVTAEDFAFTWREMRTAGVQSSFLLDDIEAADALDARTLEVRLREPRNYFPYVLADTPSHAWPQHVVERFGPDWRRAENLVASGPFVLAELTSDHATLEASPTWTAPRGNVRQVHVAWASPTEWPTIWGQGKLDVMEDVERPQGRSPDTIVVPRPRMATHYLGFRADVTPFDAEKARKAFAYAIDRERLSASASWGESSEGGGFVPPSLSGHSHRVALDHDLDRARDLLAEAGYPGGRGLPEIAICVIPTIPMEWLAELTRQLRELGADVQLVPGDVGDAFPPRDTNAWVWGWAADYPDPSGMLDTVLRYQRELYRDAEIDALLARTRTSHDRDERLRLYREVEQLWIAEHAAIVPLNYPRTAVLHRPWVEGFWASAFGWATFDEVVIRR